jgi:Trypsin-co-occurring domain 1
MHEYFEFEDGTLVEIAPESHSSQRHEMRLLREVAGTFGDAMEAIGQRARVASDALRQQLADADEVHMEMAFHLEATSGLPAIASVKGDVHFRVMCTWTRPRG